MVSHMVAHMVSYMLLYNMVLIASLIVLPFECEYETPILQSLKFKTRTEFVIPRCLVAIRIFRFVFEKFKNKFLTLSLLLPFAGLKFVT